jgi:hypothetical protein
MERRAKLGGLVSQRTTVVNLRRGESYDIYAGRPGPLGNPIIPGHQCPVCLNIHKSSGSTVPCFAIHFQDRIDNDADYRTLVVAGRGKRLACFCRPKEGFRGRLLCHVQIIAGWLDDVRPEDVP